MKKEIKQEKQFNSSITRKYTILQGLASVLLLTMFITFAASRIDDIIVKDTNKNVTESLNLITRG